MEKLSYVSSKKKIISYQQKLFIKTSLKRLGINPNTNGFTLIQKAIFYAYMEDSIILNLEKIYKYISHEIPTISAKGVESLIRYSFYNINTKKLFANYEKIFGIEFDYDYFTIKNVISEFVDLLESQKI